MKTTWANGKLSLCSTLYRISGLKGNDAEISIPSNSLMNRHTTTEDPSKSQVCPMSAYQQFLCVLVGHYFNANTTLHMLNTFPLYISFSYFFILDSIFTGAVQMTNENVVKHVHVHEVRRKETCFEEV